MPSDFDVCKARGKALQEQKRYRFISDDMPTRQTYPTRASNE